MRSKSSDLADVLSKFMERAGVGSDRLATLVNELVGEKIGKELTTRSSILNWQEGTNRRSRYWQPLVAIAIVLNLTHQETNSLLAASGHPTITRLPVKANTEDEIIVQLWEEARYERQRAALQERAQDSIDQEKQAKILHFLGRETEIKQILAHLKPSKVIALCGPGGVGKTAIVIEVLHRLTPQDKPPKAFPDGILFHNFYEEPHASLVFQHIAKRFSLYPSDAVPTTREAAQRALAGRQVLLILDGAENAKDLDKVVSIRGNCGILMTSRTRLEADFCCDIEALSESEAGKLLKAWGEDWANTQEAIAEICDLVGGLPLALRLIGSHLATRKLYATEFLPLLREDRLESLSLDDRQRESVGYVLKKSTEALSEPARLTLALSGLLGFALFSNEVMAAGHGVPLTKVYAPLGELVHTSLLDRPKERYRPAHILIHQYAQTYLSDLVSLDHVTQLMTYFSTLAQKETERGGAGLIQLALEQPHILALLQNGRDRNLWEPCLVLSASIDEYLDLRGQWEDRLVVNEIRQIAAQTSAQEAEEGQALIRLGIAHFQLSQWQQAEEKLLAGLAVAEHLELAVMQAWAELNLGNLWLRRNDYKQAQTWYERALKTSHHAYSPLYQARALNGLGNCYSNLGNLQEAVTKYEECLYVFQEALIAEPNIEVAKAMDNLATCYREEGDFEKAMQLHRRALEIFQEAGDIHAEILATMRMGNVYLRKTQFVEAVSWYERSRKQSQAIKDRYALNMILINLGITYRRQNQYPKAEQVLLEAKQNAEALNDDKRLGGALNSLGQVYREQGQFDRAREHYQAALTRFRAIGAVGDEGASLTGLGDTYLALEDYSAATNYYNQALAIFENKGIGPSKVYVLRGLGLVCHAQGQDEQARTYAQQGLDQCQPDWPVLQDLNDLLKSLDK